MAQPRRALVLFLGGLGLLASASFFACLDATQIDGALSSDVTICAPVTGEQARFALRVAWLDSASPEPTQSDGTFDRCSGGTPSAYLGNFTLLPESSDGREHYERVEVLVDTLGGAPDACIDRDTSGALKKLPANCIVIRRKVRFVPHTGLRVPMYLDDRCLGVSCDQDSTCFRGECKPADAPCADGFCVPEHERLLSPNGLGWDPSRTAGLPPGAIGRTDAGLILFPDGATTNDSGNIVTSDGSVIGSDGAVLPEEDASDGSTSSDAADAATPAADTGADGGAPQASCAPCAGQLCCATSNVGPFFCRPMCDLGEMTCTSAPAVDAGFGPKLIADCVGKVE